MHKYFLIPLAALAFVLTGCFESDNLAEACQPHGGVKGEVRVEAHDHDRDGEADGESGYEATCVDGAEADLEAEDGVTVKTAAGTTGWLVSE